MIRIFLSAIVIILGFLALVFVWFTNPLYTFVAGVLMVVIVLVGISLVVNLGVNRPSPQEEEALQPRRTGEFRRVRSDEQPEEIWDHSAVSSGGAGLDNVQWLGTEPAENTVSSDKPIPEHNSPAKVVSPNAQTGDGNLMNLVNALEPGKQQEFYALLSDTPVNEQTETQLMLLYNQIMTAGDTDSSLPDIQFSAYYPRRAEANTEYGLYVYAHLPEALVQANVEQFASGLGGRIPKPSIAQNTAQVATGTTLSAIVVCDELEFNQMGAIQQWETPFVRFDFRFKAGEHLVDEIVSGRVAILMGMIEIASIDFKVMVAPIKSMAIISAIPQDPRDAYNYDASETTGIYQKIFISYSRKDSFIAEHYRAIQMMAGNIVFMDTHSIRAGQDWEVALKQFIDEADVFQLFWSEHAATSDHVKFEWDYALKHRCPQTRCVQFIRPAYWQKPLMGVPEELSHLNFVYVKLA